MSDTGKPAEKELSATSEVRCPRDENSENIMSEANSSDTTWRTMFELQNRHMMSLIEAVKTPTADTLPEFNPEATDADPRAWCSTVNLCLSEEPLQGSALIIALSTALKGNASQWFSQVSCAGMQWHQFKELFTARYDSAETAAATLINLQSSCPKENENLAVYASRLITMLTSRWQKLNMEQIAISTVFAHIAQFDSRIQRIAFTSEILTRDKLQREINALACIKRRYPGDFNCKEELTNAKLIKTNTTPLRCFHCDKIGHKTVDCRTRGEKPHIQTQHRNIDKSSVVCFRCGMTGHIASKCPRGAATVPSGGAVGSSGGATGGGLERASTNARASY